MKNLTKIDWVLQNKSNLDIIKKVIIGFCCPSDFGINTECEFDIDSDRDFCRECWDSPIDH